MAKVAYTFDTYEDREELETFQKCDAMHAAIHDTYNIARERLKWGEDLTEKEAQTLDRIKEELHSFI